MPASKCARAPACAQTRRDARRARFSQTRRRFSRPRRKTPRDAGRTAPGRLPETHRALSARGSARRHAPRPSFRRRFFWLSRSTRPSCSEARMFPSAASRRLRRRSKRGAGGGVGGGGGGAVLRGRVRGVRAAGRRARGARDGCDARRVANDARATGSEGSGARRLPAGPEPAASLPKPPNATGAPNATSAQPPRLCLPGAPSRPRGWSPSTDATPPARRGRRGSPLVFDATKSLLLLDAHRAALAVLAHGRSPARAAPRGARGGSAITTRVAPRFAVRPGPPSRARPRARGVARTRRSGARIECASNAKPSAKAAPNATRFCNPRADSRFAAA